MKPRKESSSAQQGLRNSRASLSRILIGDPEHQTGEWQAASLTGVASAQARRQASRGQGLKILAREAKNIAARFVPKSRTKWSWDCRTPDVALTGIFVSGGALAFLRILLRALKQPILSSPDLSPWDGDPTRRTSALAACRATHERAGRALI